ncbi:hypothetical protein RF11_00076 [Thelohanellus kitauei]|uniref:Apple domain-containing protein n=1 Tax=Thelohanellus kitauei TaxID=669202 RepID=A0A0C2J837_THEKT|nr:hypothetical protein RF11_00076 [Thelohanellus kitauei]
MRLVSAVLMSHRLVCFFLILQFTAVYTEFSSIQSLFEDCISCVSHPLCVWVLEMQHYLTSPLTKSGNHHCVLKESTTKFNSRHFYDPIPKVVSHGTMNYWGFDLNPSWTRLMAKPDAEMQFQILVKPEFATKLDIYFLIQQSMPTEGILTLISNKLNDIVTDLKGSFSQVKIGIGKFSDIPVYPFIELPSQSSAT